MKRLLTTLLILLIIPASSKEPDPPPQLTVCGIIIGVTVIVVGAIVVKSIIKTCDKCLGPSGTNSTPFSATGDMFMRVECSTNLVNWQTLLITNAPLGAEFEFNNPPHGPNGECFYRVRGW